MIVELLIIADLYVFVVPEGEVKGVHLATLYHQTQFDSVEACEHYKDAHGDQIVEHLKGPFQAFWMQELNARSRDIYVETSADCYDMSS